MDFHSQLSSSSSSSPTTSIWTSFASDFPYSSPTSSLCSSNSANNSDHDPKDMGMYSGYLGPVGDGEPGFGATGLDWELERVEKSWNCSSSSWGSSESTSTSPSFSLLHLDPRTIHIPAAETTSLSKSSNSVHPGLLHSSSPSSKTRRVDLGAVGSDGEELDEDELAQKRRKEKRKVTNRISARNFRERRRKEQNQLEKVLELRDHELEALRKEAGRLRAENSNLKADDGQ